MTEGSPVDHEHFIRSAYAGRRAGAPVSSLFSASPFFNALCSQGRRYITSQQRTSNNIPTPFSCLHHSTAPGPSARLRRAGAGAGASPPDRRRGADRDRLRTTGRDRPGGDERHAGRRRGERNHAGSAAPPGPVAVMAARLSWARRTGRAPGPVRRDSRLAVLDGPTGATSPSTTTPRRPEAP